MRLPLICCLFAIVAAAPTIAADAPRAAIGDEHRLSEAEVQRILDTAALRRQALPVPVTQPDVADPPPRPIEGELGVGIGTGGYREAFGTAVVPLGQDGVAILSFDRVESHRGRRRR